MTSRDHTTVRAPLEETGAQIGVQIQAHALRRFVERVSPGLDAIHATAVLTELAAFASITATPPNWLSHRSRAPMYLALGDAVDLDRAAEPSTRSCSPTSPVPSGHRRSFPRGSGRLTRAPPQAHRLSNRTAKKGMGGRPSPETGGIRRKLRSSASGGHLARTACLPGISLRSAGGT